MAILADTGYTLISVNGKYLKPLSQIRLSASGAMSATALNGWNRQISHIIAKNDALFVFEDDIICAVVSDSTGKGFSPIIDEPIVLVPTRRPAAVHFCVIDAGVATASCLRRLGADVDTETRVVVSDVGNFWDRLPLSRVDADSYWLVLDRTTIPTAECKKRVQGIDCALRPDIIQYGTWLDPSSPVVAVRLYRTEFLKHMRRRNVDLFRAAGTVASYGENRYAGTTELCGVDVATYKIREIGVDKYVEI